MTVTSRRGIWNNFWFRQQQQQQQQEENLEEPRGERQCRRARCGAAQVRRRGLTSIKDRAADPTDHVSTTLLS